MNQDGMTVLTSEGAMPVDVRIKSLLKEAQSC
jgi:hypothetical protein